MSTSQANVSSGSSGSSGSNGPNGPNARKSGNKALVVALSVCVFCLACVSAACIYALANGAGSLPIIGGFFADGGGAAGEGEATTALAGAQDATAASTEGSTQEATGEPDATAAADAAGIAGDGGDQGQASGTSEAEGPEPTPGPIDPSIPVALVGDMPITQYEFSFYLNMTRQYYDIDDIDLMRFSAMQAVTDLKIHCDKAGEMGVTLTDDDQEMYDSIVNEIVPYYAQLEELTDEEYIDKYYGVTLDEYNELMQSIILNDRLSYTLLDGIDVSDEEAEARYEKDPLDYNNVTVQHILFLFEGRDEESPRTKEESLALAEDALRRVEDGEDFGELVKELSDDNASVDTGGEYTITRNDQFVEEFSDWAFNASPGDTGLVETEYGYHVMKLDQIRDTFDDFKDTIIVELKQESLVAQYDAWRDETQYELTVNQDVFDSFA